MVSEYSAAMRAAMASICASACSIETPSRSRPTTSARFEPRSACSGSMPSGSHTFSLNGKWKPSGITPTTVARSALARTLLPTMSGSPAYRFCHTS